MARWQSYFAWDTRAQRFFETDIAAFGDQLANELSAHTRAAASHNCDPACEILHTRTSLGFRHLSMRKGRSLTLCGVKADRLC